MVIKGEKMTEKQWESFCQFKKDLKLKVEEWTAAAPELMELQKAAAQQTKTPLYPFETSVVYNRDYDRITKDDDIHLIVIGDNPGKDEQLAKNNRYLVGQAGKIAEGFFKKNPNLGTDFRKNVIIVNKTPIHSAKTNQLKRMVKELKLLMIPNKHQAVFLFLIQQKKNLKKVKLLQLVLERITKKVKNNL